MVAKTKKPAAKKPSTKKASAAPAVVKAIAEKQTKSQIYQAIASDTGLTIKQVKQTFLSAAALLKGHMMKRGSGEFAIPELSVKVNRKTKPATKKREGRNPMTGETLMIAAKPKRDIIRIRALKALKEVVA